MTIEVRPLIFKPQYLNGLTEKLLVSHYENNYGGALRRLNAIEARIRTLDWATAPVFEINGLKREELIAAGSVILHEAYFDSLGGGGGDPPSGLGIAEALERDFGSVAAWTAEFTAMAKAQAGGSGLDDAGVVGSAGTADQSVVGGSRARLGGWRADPGARYVRACLSPGFWRRAAAYVDAVMGNLHWERIAARYRQVRHGEAADVALFTPFGSPTQSRVVDIGRGAARGHATAIRRHCWTSASHRRFAAPPRHVAGRHHAQSDAIDHWAETLPRDKPIVVYCIFGFQISGNAVAELRQRGFDARGLKGGIGAWHAIGGPTVPLDQTTYES